MASKDELAREVTSEAVASLRYGNAKDRTLPIAVE